VSRCTYGDFPEKKNIVSVQQCKRRKNSKVNWDNWSLVLGTGLGIYYVSPKHNMNSVRLTSNKIPYSTPSPVLTTGEHKGFITLSTSTKISCSTNDHNI